MTPNEFYKWMAEFGNRDANWPKLKPMLLDEKKDIIQEFLSKLKESIEQWPTHQNKADMPELINQTLKLNESFTTPYTVKAARNFIISIIQRGNYAGFWNLPVPQLAVLNFRQKNPFQNSSLQNYALFQPVFERFLHDLKTEKISLFNEAQKIGFTLFSSCYLGGLIRTDLLIGLIDNINGYQHCIHDSWFDFKENDQIYFRWHPDPISEKLIISNILSSNYFSDRKQTKELILKAINAYLRTLSENFTLASLYPLFRAIETHYHLNLPEVVTHYLMNPQRSTPLPEDSWRRYRDLATEPLSSVESNETITTTFPVEAYSSPTVDLISQDQNKAYRNFYTKVFSVSSEQGKKDSPGKFVEKCFQFLSENEHHLAQPLFFLIQWLSFRVENGLKISSAGTYASNLKPIVLGLLNINFKTIGAEELLDAYNKVLVEKRERSTQKSVVRLSSRIKDFHVFLYLYAQAPEIPFQELLFNRDNQRSLAKANVLSEKEIEHIQQVLEKNHPRYRFVFLLGVRLGLRASEVAHLQFQHFVGWRENHELFVFITNTEFHNNKTASARRKISLKKFLTPKEYQSFITFYLERRDEIGALNSKSNDSKVEMAIQQITAAKKHFIFSESSHQPLDRTEIDEVITPVIKTITGDLSLSFHSLRHSFVNHVLMDMLISHPTLQRDKLKAFSYEVGHLSPEETFKTYFHLMPVVAKHYLTRNLESLLKLSVPEACKLFGYTDTKFIEKTYKKAKTSNSMYDAIASYYRKESHFKPFREIPFKRKPGAKKTVKKTRDQSWMHPKLFYLCITTEQDGAFLKRLASVNQRPEDFYINVQKIKNMLIRQIEGGARGLTWPKGAIEEKQLLKTYRGVEMLSEVNQKKFQHLFSKNRDNKNIVLQTDNVLDAVKYCQFLEKIIGSSKALLIKLSPESNSKSLPAEVQAQTWLKNLQEKGIPVKEIWLPSQKTPVSSIEKAKKHTQGKISITLNNGHNKASHGFKMGVVLSLTYNHFLNRRDSNET